MEFKELELLPALQNNIEKAKFYTLTAIQEQAIPFALTGRDITGLAQTGTGKTLAFLVPSINRLLKEKPDSGKTYILALAPTRELVMQIAEVATKLLDGTGYSVATIIGGTDYKGQEASLSSNPGIIVATPGRLIDFVKSRNLDITQVKIVIIDEADRMFDMGFVNDLKYVFHKCKDRIQTMLFSATLSFEIIRLAYKYLNEPVEVQVDPEKIISERIDQKLYHLGRDEKLPYLVNFILNDRNEGLGIIFTNYKNNIPLIIRSLHRYGVPTAGLSSDFDQKKRIRLLKDFKLGKYKMMVATDVASRGIDVANIDVVYNYDLPMDSENYVHRIGRTARAGKKGRSISFCSETDYQELERIEKYLKTNIPVEAVLEDFLIFPKGDFVAYESDDPAITKSLQEKPRHREHGRERERSRTSRPSPKKKDIAKPSSKPRREIREERTASIKKSPPTKKNVTQNANYDKSRRNLFDIEEIKSIQKKEKKSIWKKLKSIFGF
jgi:ATP-dependent RNA helicase RhlB